MGWLLISGDQRCGLISVGWWIIVGMILSGASKRFYFYLRRLWNFAKTAKPVRERWIYPPSQTVSDQDSEGVEASLDGFFDPFLGVAGESVCLKVCCCVAMVFGVVSVSRLHPFCGSLSTAAPLRKCTLAFQVLLIFCGIRWCVTGAGGRFIVVFVCFFPLKPN